MKTDSEPKGPRDSDKSIADKKSRPSVSKSKGQPAQSARQKSAHMQFAHIIEKINEGFVALDTRMNYVFINQRGSELLQRKPEDLIGKNHWEEYPQDKETSFGKAYLQALETRTPVEIEDYYASTDRWFSNRIHPSESGLSIFFNDITERKRAEAEWELAERKRVEEALRESERKFDLIYDKLPFAAALSRPADGVLVNVNAAFERIFGYTKQDVLGKNSFELSINPDAEVQARILSELQARGSAHDVEAKLFTKLGGERVFLLNIDHVNVGEEQYILQTAQDITERKQAEDALRLSEERFKRFMQHLPGLAWIKDLQGRYVYANATAEKAFNASQENLYGRTDQDIFPPDIAVQFMQNDQRALTEGRGIQVIETLPHEDGVLHYSLVSKFPIPGPDGNPAMIGGTAFDITERKQAEEKLRRSEERERVRAAQLEAIMEAVPAVIWIAHDAECHVVSRNRASYEVLRLPVGGNASLSAAEGIRPANFEVWHDGHLLQPDELPVQRAARGEEVHNFEEEVRFEDGTSVYLFGNAITLRDAENNPAGALAAFVDITARKRAEEALQQLNFELESRVERRTAELRSVNERLVEEIKERTTVEEALRESDETTRLILDTSPDVIVIANKQGQIMRVNAQIEKLFGCQSDEVVGKPIEALIPQRFHGRHVEHRSYYTENPHRRPMGLGMELFGQRKDGTEFSVDVMLTPIHNIADWDTMVTIRDSTERKQMENALRESHKRLQSLSQRLVEVQEEERRAIARELHDRVGQSLAALNLNLTIINNQLSSLVNEQVNARLSDSLDLIAELIALVRDVMSNLRPAVLDDFGLEAALQTSMESFRSRYDIGITFEKNQSLIPRLGPSIEMTLFRIAQEALLNAVRHAQADQVTLSLQIVEKAVRLTVQDNGIGIQSWQTDNQSGSHGLTIMRERAEAVGGNLRVSSTPGKGTQIEVNIPFQAKTSKEEH